MEQTATRDPEDIEIDLNRYFRILAKRKATFFGVAGIIFVSGLAYILFSPKIYRITVLLQPPVSGEALTGASDLESPENLRGLIVNKAFDEALRKKLSLDPYRPSLEFSVVVPDKTNILKVSLDLREDRKQFGVTVLQNLVALISEGYAKRIDLKMNELASRIKQNEHFISDAQEKVVNLKDQIKEINSRQDKLNEEVKTINTATNHILEKRKDFLKNSAVADSVDIFIANFIQNNVSYGNQLNNQFSELSIRKDNIELETKTLYSQIKDYQMTIENLNSQKAFISNVRVLAQPKSSRDPISPDKVKILTLFSTMGLFFGVFAVFCQQALVARGK